MGTFDPPASYPLAVGQEKPFMITAFVNMGNGLLSDRDVLCILAMLNIQMTRHVGPDYGQLANGIYYAGQGQAAADKVVKEHPNYDLHLLLKHPDQPGAAGYHEQVGGRSISKSFLEPELDNGGSILGNPANPEAPAFSTVVGHETIEDRADRETNDYRDGPPMAHGNSVAFEPGDPDEVGSYPIGDDPVNKPEEMIADPDDGSKGVIVMATNYVTLHWFNPQLNGMTTPSGTPILYDHMGRLSNPFTMLPGGGGYMIVRAGGPGTEQQVFADRSGKHTTDPAEYRFPWRLAHRQRVDSRWSLRKAAALRSLVKAKVAP